MEQGRLEAQLGAPLGPSGPGKHFLGKRLPERHDAADWTLIMDWMTNRSKATAGSPVAVRCCARIRFLQDLL